MPMIKIMNSPVVCITAEAGAYFIYKINCFKAQIFFKWYIAYV